MSEIGVHQVCESKSAVTCDEMIGINISDDISSDNKKANTSGNDNDITNEGGISATTEKVHTITHTVSSDSSTKDVLHNQGLTDSDTADTEDKTRTTHIDNTNSTNEWCSLKREEFKSKNGHSKENDTCVPDKAGRLTITSIETKREPISDGELMSTKRSGVDKDDSKNDHVIDIDNDVENYELTQDECSSSEAMGVHNTCVQMDQDNDSETDTRLQDRENNNTTDTGGSKTPCNTSDLQVNISTVIENDSMAYRTKSDDDSSKQMHRQEALAEPLYVQRNANYYFQDQSYGRERIFASVSSLLCVIFYTFLFGIIACIESTSCSRSRIYFSIPVSIIYVVYLTESLMDKTTRNFLRNPMSFKQFGYLVHRWRTRNPKATITVRLLPGWHVSGNTVEELEKNRKISATMIYKKCVDQSDDIVQMATHKRYKVIVHSTFTCADTITRKNLEREIAGFKKYCGFNDKGMECIRELELEGFQKRLLVYEDKKPWYLSTCVYWLSVGLALNGPLRVWIYFRFSETFNYNIIKAVSVQRQ